MSNISTARKTASSIAVAELSALFPSCQLPTPIPSQTDIHELKMERDDAPILRYLFAAHRPLRHLEFGTWQGFGACLCLESCDATVWTINLSDGESRQDGSWAYGERIFPGNTVPPGAVTENFGTDALGPRDWLRTDAGGSIGHLYREKGLGHRVCQVYCDSRQWDHDVYPRNFFDSALIDGGHSPEVVSSDTRKAMHLLRPGGMILWHDFYPATLTDIPCESVQGVRQALAGLITELSNELQLMVWIEQSWLMLGVKR